jgi:hypothetical protein
VFKIEQIGCEGLLQDRSFYRILTAACAECAAADDEQPS